MAAPVFVGGIGAFADRYAGFVLDQWGVIHNGTEPFADALDALIELRRRNKRVVLLSNSGRRAALNQARLEAMGFGRSLFDAVVTSGEAAWSLLRYRSHAPWSELGRRCLLLTINGDLEVVAGLGLELVAEPEAADFILATALEIPPLTLDHYRDLARRAVGRGVPLVCSNPDKVAPTADGLQLSPGTLAEIYRELGGTVHFVGKPHQPIYGACFDALDGLEPGEIVAVGDSLEHDIQGARNAGIAAAFVTTGIHAEAFPAEAGEVARADALARLAAAHGVVPDWVLPRLVW
jgi:HAD superfamily hydrolase (TIGR01459 family)